MELKDKVVATGDDILNKLFDSKMSTDRFKWMPNVINIDSIGIVYRRIKMNSFNL